VYITTRIHKDHCQFLEGGIELYHRADRVRFLGTTQNQHNK